MSTTTAKKWDSSLGIRIPKEVADSIGISPGSEPALAFGCLCTSQLEHYSESFLSCVVHMQLI